jgi:hypothetical protein
MLKDKLQKKEKNKTAYVYLIRYKNENLWKFGQTTAYKVNGRFRNIKYFWHSLKDENVEIEQMAVVQYSNSNLAELVEQLIHYKFSAQNFEMCGKDHFVPNIADEEVVKLFEKTALPEDKIKKKIEEIF